MYECIEQCHR
jgi:hypothetical protein